MTFSNYRNIKQTLFIDADFRSLSPDSRLLLLTIKLLGDICGLKYWSWDILTDAVGFKDKRLDRAFRELEIKPWVLREGKLIWLVNGLKHDPQFEKMREKIQEQIQDPKKPTTTFLTAIIREVNSVPDCELKATFCAFYRYAIPTLPTSQAYPIDTLPIPYRHPNGGVNTLKQILIRRTEPEPQTQPEPCSGQTTEAVPLAEPSEDP